MAGLILLIATVLVWHEWRLLRRNLPRTGTAADAWKFGHAHAGSRAAPGSPLDRHGFSDYATLMMIMTAQIKWTVKTTASAGVLTVCAAI